MRITTLIAGFVVLALTSNFANAEEEDGGFSGNVTIASDYSFRGVSQTNLLPAVQGGFDYELDNGFSFGTWSSNVNFGDGTSQELDLYFGYSMDLNDDASMSFGFYQFEYPGEGESLDYQELSASIDFNSISLGVVFSPNYVGVDDLQFTYLSAGYSSTLGEDVSLSASIGLNTAEDGFFDGEDSYIDYSVGVSVPVSGLDLGLNVVGTTMEDVEGAEARLIFSLGKSL